MEVSQGYTLQTRGSLPLLGKKTRYAIRKAKQHLEIKRGTLEDLRRLHWNPSYLPIWIPDNMRVYVANFNGRPVSAVAIVEDLDNRRIIYKYSGNNQNFKHLQGNALLLYEIAKIYSDETDILDLGGGSTLKPNITAFKRHMSTGSYDKPTKKRTLLTRLNYRLGSWLPNKVADLFREPADAPYFMFLNYHETTPEIFESHVEYLDKHYTLCDLDILREHYSTNKAIPDKACFITFDDGWRSNYDLIKVINGHLLSLTIFISTGYIGTNQDPRTKTDTVNRIMLNEIEIVEMVKHGVNFQSHGVTHTDANKQNVTKFITELEESKRFIENLTGKPVYALAYPYNKHNPSFSVEKWYEMARIGGRTLNTNKQNKYLINSIGVDGNWTVEQLKHTIRKATLKTWRNRQ